MGVVTVALRSTGHAHSLAGRCDNSFKSVHAMAGIRRDDVFDIFGQERRTGVFSRMDILDCGQVRGRGAGWHVHKLHCTRKNRAYDQHSSQMLHQMLIHYY